MSSRSKRSRSRSGAGKGANSSGADASSGQSSQNISTAIKSLSIINGRMAGYGMMGAVAQVQSSQLKFISDLRSLRDNWVTNSIYDIIGNELFSVNVEESISVLCPDDKIRHDIEELLTKLKVVRIVKDSVPDLLHYGSYPFTPLVNSTGLVGITEDFESGEVLEFKGIRGDTKFHFINKIVADSVGSMAFMQTPEVVGENDIAMLSLSNGFARVNIDMVGYDNKDNDLTKILGDTIKISVPASLISGSMEKLRDLLLLDKISLAKDLANLLAPTVLGIPLPDSNNVTEMLEVVNKYDDLINGRILSSDNINANNFSLNDIARVKLIPSPSSKGSPQVIDTGAKDNEIGLDKFRVNLEMFLQSIGIPPELMIGQMESETSRKVYVRYAKMIKKIAQSISEFIEKIVKIHFLARKEPVPEFSISVKTNANMDVIESTDARDLLLSSTKLTISSLEDMEQAISKSDYQVDWNVVIEKFSKDLASVDSEFAGLFIKKPDMFTNVGKTSETGISGIFSAPTKETAYPEVSESFVTYYWYSKDIEDTTELINKLKQLDGVNILAGEEGIEITSINESADAVSSIIDNHEDIR